MFRNIVLALTAVATLSAAVLVPTSSSAFPAPPMHPPHVGPAGGPGFAGFPYIAGLPRLPGTVLVCRHTWSGHPFDCHQMPTAYLGGRWH